MGVEYIHFLVPRDRTFRSRPAQLARLTRALVDGGWLPELPERPDEGFFAALADRDLIAGWSVDDLETAGTRYPFAQPGPQPYYTVRLEAAVDLVHYSGETVELESTDCSCGESLEYEPEGKHASARLRLRCEHCGAAFDPSRAPGTRTDASDGTQTPFPGGGAYRFALVVDCGKSVPPGRPELHPELTAIVRDALDVDLVDFGDYY